MRNNTNFWRNKKKKNKIHKIAMKKNKNKLTLNTYKDEFLIFHCVYAKNISKIIIEHLKNYILKWMETQKTTD